MSSSTHPPIRRCAATWAALSAAGVLLSGCYDREAASGTLTATVAACEIAEATDRCTLQVAWTSTGADTLQLHAPGDRPPSAVAASGVADLPVPPGGGEALLIGDGVVLASLSLSARCAARSAADATGVCRPIPLRYSDKVYALYAGYPFAVGAERASPVVNRSRLALAEQAARPCDIVIIARPETLRADFGTLVAEIAVAIDRAKPAGKNHRARPAGKSPGSHKPAVRPAS